MNISELRQGFKEYIRTRFPNDRNINSTVSMAFFLERYGNEMGIDFKQVLSSGAVPSSYKQVLEDYFRNRGRKEPRGQSAIYERALRLLLEFINTETPIAPATSIVKTDTPVIVNKSLEPKIPRPTYEAVIAYLEKWKLLSGYREQEEALNLLFHETYPSNTNLSEVLVKCSALNDFYGTNIFSIYPLASHIVALDIDIRLVIGDPKLVNDISRGHGITARSGKEIHLFSFATKYCSHHMPFEFPIFDSFVEKVLIYFRDMDRFSVFKNDELRDYPIFKRVVLDFRKAYNLERFNLKQLDQYLWQFGKEYFPKQYKRGENRATPAMR